MDNNLIVIDDSDDEHPDVSSHRQPDLCTVESSRTASAMTHGAFHSQAPQPRSSFSAFQHKRRSHDANTHPHAKNRSSALPKSSSQRDADDRIPINRQTHRIVKKTKTKSQKSKASRRPRSRDSPSPDYNPEYKLLPKHRVLMQRANIEAAARMRLGLPKSRLRIPTASDPESMHREFFVKRIEAKKIEKDIAQGYIERVEERHVVQLDDLDPELLTGRPLTEKEAYWVKKKQARRAGPRSSNWPTTMPTHDQHTEYIRFTEKCDNLFDPNAPECCECGSRLWGTSIRYPLSRPADSYPSGDVIDRGAPLCLGCSRLFSCVRDRAEKMEMINWIINRQLPRRADPEPTDQALMALCKRRVGLMRYRAHQHYRSLPDNFVTPEELFERVKYDNYNCYLIGSPMCLQTGRFDSLTFDHIFPISIAMMKDDCWSIDNMQPMAHCMNQVKGNEANKEAKRWLVNFKLYYYSSKFKA